ncbi:Tripartite motif-containing protein 46 [Heterocephalus glaber]|uniref:Tripartite motif-containing protein 46 n=1 Tax=Heterocephalus glaber TaxID=10181 RepID=G5BDF1_HETGA|nr:Tripartite motif-containing protein 46 [Heterocephalus glaber]
MRSGGSPHPHRSCVEPGARSRSRDRAPGAAGRAMAEGEDMQTFTSIMDALVRISTSMRNMEKELLCPVCQEMYKQPLVLPCTHNVCQACAREVLGQQGYLGHGFGTYPGRKRGALHPQVVMFPCPACQGDVELGERGLAGLFRNLTLERVVERYRQSVSVGGAILCQLCKPPPLEATKGCTECRATFCNECFKLFHPWGTQKAQHEPTLPTLSFRPKGLMCPDHKEEVTHYCKTCQRLVCQLCRVRRTHSGHKITPVLSAYQALKDKLTKSLTYILGNQDTVQTQICELEETVRHTEVSGQQAKEEVSQLVRGLGAVLEEKRASLLQAIEECQQERLARLSTQLQEHQSLLDGSGLVGYAQEVLKETDQPCFVQAAKQLHNRPLPEPGPLTCPLPEAPVIDTQRTFAYDQIFLCWRLPPHSPPAWHYTVEFRRTDVPAQQGPTRWQRREEVRGTSALLENPDTGSVYVLRVRGCNKAGYGEYSEDVHLHTPPAPVLHFFLDGRWGASRERLAISKDQRAVRSVPGLPLLLAAERLLTGCHLSVDVVLGDVAVTQGRSYWACAVDPASYLVKVGVGLESKLQESFQGAPDVISPRYDPDSGHDSGAEDATVEAAPPFAFLTIGMGKILLGSGASANAGLTGRDGPAASCTVPLPPRLGICLDYERGRVSFLDAVSFRGLLECPLDCSGPVCPAFCFIGGGAVQLQEPVGTKPERKVTIGGFAKLD